MRRILYPAMLVLLLLLAACQPAGDESLPTLVSIPSATATETATNTPEASDTPTPTPTDEPTATPTITDTPEPTATTTPTDEPTNTPEDTSTPTATENATQAVVNTATAAFIEAPRFATFTPVPAGVQVAERPTSTGTPLVAADLVITADQFQEEVDRLIADIAAISEASVSFSDGQVNVRMTASIDGTPLTGDLYIAFQMMSEGRVNNVLQLMPSPPDAITLDTGDAAPDGFIELAYSDMAPLILEAFSFIIDQRLGVGQHDLEYLTISDDVIDIFLVVPER